MPFHSLPGGVMAAQTTLTRLVMVRIHAGQPSIAVPWDVDDALLPLWRGYAKRPRRWAPAIIGSTPNYTPSFPFSLRFIKKGGSMAAKLLKGFLDSWGVRYLSIRHSPAHSAQEVAQLSHISGHNFAKTIIVKIEGIMAMMIIPASRRINLDDMAELLQVDHIRLATEAEFRERFPDCELGAMPPFGNLYDMSTYLAEELSLEQEIAFNAGSHSEIITMRYEDYSSLVKPAVLNFVTV